MSLAKFDGMNLAKAQVETMVKAAIETAIANGELAQPEVMKDFVVEIPQDLRNGDFSTNAAMVNSKVFRSNPRAIATAIMKYMEFDGTFFERAELAGPGFINFFLGKEYFETVVKAGANLLVAGSCVFNGDLAANVKRLTKKIAACSEEMK